MLIRKKWILIILIVLLLTFAIGILIYTYFPSKKIVVTDTSNNYNIKIQNQKALDNYLNEIGAWKEDNTTEKSNSYFTLKLLNIVLTDNNKGKFQFLNNDNTTRTRLNIESNEKKGILTINIYLSPQLTKSNTKDLSDEVLFQIILALKTTIGKNRITEQQAMNLAQKDSLRLVKENTFLVTPSN